MYYKIQKIIIIKNHNISNKKYKAINLLIFQISVNRNKLRYVNNKHK